MTLPSVNLNNPAYRLLITEGFPTLSAENIPKINANFEKIAAEQPTGLMISPRTGNMVVSELYSEYENIKNPLSESSLERLKPVECSLFKCESLYSWDNLWNDNIIPIMGKGIYHRNGSPFDKKDLARANLFPLVNDKGKPVILKAFASGNRVTSLPGPWIVPFINTANGLRILKTRDELQEAYGKPIGRKQTEEILEKMYLKGEIGLKLASDLQFKGSGCANMPQTSLFNFLGNSPAYIPAFPFKNISSHIVIRDGVGAVSADERTAYELEEELRPSGAVFLADTVSVKKLFDENNLLELISQDEYDQVLISQRMSYNTYRMEMFVEDYIYDEMTPMFVGGLYFEPYIKELYDLRNIDHARLLYFKRSYNNLARNISAALPKLIRRTDPSNIPANWGTSLEMIDTSSLISEHGLNKESATKDFIRSWKYPWELLSFVYNNGQYGQNYPTINNSMFFDSFLNVFFKGNEHKKHSEQIRKRYNINIIDFIVKKKR